MENFVANELGTLRKILIHSPDDGIGKIIPSKFKEWLYDDTVHLTKMREEYDDYVMLLLEFVDPEKAKEVRAFRKNNKGDNNRDIFNPSKKEFYNSDKVIDVQKALSDILKDEKVRLRLTSAICAIENCSLETQYVLEQLDAKKLANVLISGVFKNEIGEDVFIFPPAPNLVFTRDIGITVKDHILLGKSATVARKRDILIAKYIFLYHQNFFNGDRAKLIEVREESDFFLEDENIQEHKVISIEGGDVMMIAPNHLIVGCSERTSKAACDAIIHKIFSNSALQIEKISIVQIPEVRAQMHIDTIFTQIKRNAWVMFGGYSEVLDENKVSNIFNYANQFFDPSQTKEMMKLKVFQFYKASDEAYVSGKNYHSKNYKGLEELLTAISVEDFKVDLKNVKIIYSAYNEFPYNEREQWTDSCNLVALKEGVVIGYDRNDKTIEAFADKENGLGFEVIHAKDLLKKVEDENLNLHNIENTLILLSSSELSRARGGSHCMSMPLIRDNF